MKLAVISILLGAFMSVALMLGIIRECIMISMWRHGVPPLWVHNIGIAHLFMLTVPFAAIARFVIYLMGKK